MVVLEKLSKMNKEELYNYLSHLIVKIYSDYKFLNIEKEKFKQIVEEVLETSILEFTSYDTYISYVNKKIRDKIDGLANKCEFDYENLNDDTYYFVDSIAELLKDIGQFPLLTYEQEKELTFKAYNGDKLAKEKLFVSNLRLVVSIAKKYVIKNTNLTFLDLFQEGCLGLIKSIDKFNPNLGYHLSTYASCWIRQKITRAIAEQGRMIKIPVHWSTELYSYKMTMEKLAQELNRMPTTKEIANEMNKTEEEIFTLRKYENDVSSINMHIGCDEETELEDFIVDEENLIEEEIENTVLRQDVKNALIKSKLNILEIDFLKMNFGLDGNRPMTFEEIGKKYGITRQAVEQKIKRILKKLRNSSYILDLKVYCPHVKLPLDEIEFKNFSNTRKYTKKNDIKSILLRLVNRVIIKQTDETNLINMLKDANFYKKEIVLFLMKYALDMDLLEISSCFAYKKEVTVYVIIKTINNKIRLSGNYEAIMEYINSPTKILEELESLVNTEDFEIIKENIKIKTK